MFESLDQVDWRGLQDAYGPSGATPGRLRDLASSSESRRAHALRDLSGTLYHQGTIYNASVAAIPFLLEIVASPEVTDRTPTLELLQALSVGGSYHEAHASLFFNREKSKTPEWEQRVKEEKSWVKAIHERLYGAVPIVVEVLRTGREKERIAAASLLATLQDNPAATEALAAACTDGQPGLAVVALTALGQLPNPPAGVLERCFEGSADDVVRTAAAIHILSHRERETPAAVTGHLLNQLRKPREEVRKAYEELPDVGAFLGDVGDALARGPRAAAEEAFPKLFEQVKASPYSLNYSESFGVLSLAVSMDPPAQGRWVPGRLTQQQRLAIRLVADRAWRIERGGPTISGNIVDLLERVGLPKKREEVFALLAGTPEGVQTPREEAKWSGKRKSPWWKFF